MSSHIRRIQLPTKTIAAMMLLTIMYMFKHVLWTRRLNFKAAGHTDPGLMRTRNEDDFFISETRSRTVAVVIDGVGGLPNGQEASSRTARYLSELLQLPVPKWVKSKTPRKWLDYLMQTAHHKLLTDGQLDPSLHRMAAAVTMALFMRNSHVVWVASLGDCPAFRLRNGDLEKLVEEDSVVADLVREGLIYPEDAEHHPQRHVITQALGLGDDLDPNIQAFDVKPGDIFLLCTDGLTDVVPKSRIA